MGQYHRVVNLTKKEYLNHYNLGAGAKVWEQAYPGMLVGTAMLLLMQQPDGRGGGDTTTGISGSWHGDHIVMIGDYAEPDDMNAVNAQNVHREIQDGNEYTDVSDAIMDVITKEFGYTVTGTGWKDIVEPK